MFSDVWSYLDKTPETASSLSSSVSPHPTPRPSGDRHGEQLWLVLQMPLPCPISGYLLGSITKDSEEFTREMSTTLVWSEPRQMRRLCGTHWLFFLNTLNLMLTSIPTFRHGWGGSLGVIALKFCLILRRNSEYNYNSFTFLKVRFIKM